MFSSRQCWRWSTASCLLVTNMSSAVSAVNPHRPSVALPPAGNPSPTFRLSFAPSRYKDGRSWRTHDEFVTWPRQMCLRDVCPGEQLQRCHDETLSTACKGSVQLLNILLVIHSDWTYSSGHSFLLACLRARSTANLQLNLNKVSSNRFHIIIHNKLMFMDIWFQLLGIIWMHVH